VKREGQNADDTADNSAVLDSTGDSYVVVGSAPNLVATLAQSLAPEAADAEYVDYSRSDVYVTFDLYPSTCGLPCASPPAWTSGNVKVGNRSDWASTGAGSAAVTAPKTLPEDSYLLVITLVPNGYVVADESDDALDVAAATGTFVTGGGQIQPDTTSNTDKQKGKFSFNVESKPKGKDVEVSGNAVYTYRMRIDVSSSTPASWVLCTTPSKTCRDVNVVIRSTKLSSLNTGSATSYPMRGFATGQAAVQVVDVREPRTHYPALELTNAAFRLDLTDTAPGGNSDRFGFSAYRKDGTLFHAATSGPIAQTGTGAAANQTALAGGNVSVHPK